MLFFLAISLNIPILLQDFWFLGKNIQDKPQSEHFHHKLLEIKIEEH
jgi:hypothetical protein